VNGFAEMISQPVTVPTYLKNDWARDWGSLERYDRYYPDAVPAQIDTNTVIRSGFWSPAPIRG
jgi:arabinosyltransferase B